jgi:hypothetical protein
MVNVALDWKRIDWMPKETWTKNILPKLKLVGLTLADLKRSVYVIRLNGDFCIRYPRGESPTIYIGEGNFSERINSHRKWVTELEDLVGDFSFQVRIAVPRVQKNAEAYLDCEAALLERFGELFGTAPLWNKQYESRRNNYLYNDKQMNTVLCKGSGAKYKWAIIPMRSSMFYKNFRRTHIDA